MIVKLQKNTFEEVIEADVVLQMTAVLFNGKQLPDDGLTLFIERLNDYALIEFKEGLRLILINRSRLTPALLIEAFRQYNRPLNRLVRFCQRREDFDPRLEVRFIA